MSQNEKIRVMVIATNLRNLADTIEVFPIPLTPAGCANAVRLEAERIEAEVAEYG